MKPLFHIMYNQVFVLIHQKPNMLGRWTRDLSKKQLNRRIDLANNDHSYCIKDPFDIQISNKIKRSLNKS